jgi:hypothetical protein
MGSEARKIIGVAIEDVLATLGTNETLIGSRVAASIAEALSAKGYQIATPDQMVVPKDAMMVEWEKIPKGCDGYLANPRDVFLGWQDKKTGSIYTLHGLKPPKETER